MTKSNVDLAKTVAAKAKAKAKEREAMILSRFKAQFYQELSEILKSGKVDVNTWHIDVGAPTTDLGKHSDLYIDRFNGKIYLNEKGNWKHLLDLKGFDGKDGTDGKAGRDGKDGYTPRKGVDFADGRPGRDGRDGTDGKDGKDGRDGKDGKDGTDGSRWHTGKGAPKQSLGIPHDFYLDAETGFYYEKADNGGWAQKGSLRGPAGRTTRVGSAAGIESIAAGTDNVTIDNTDPKNPIVSVVGDGTGDVVGPAESENNSIPRYDGESGKQLKSSQVFITDEGYLFTTIIHGGTALDIFGTYDGSGGALNLWGGDGYGGPNGGDLNLAGGWSDEGTYGVVRIWHPDSGNKAGLIVDGLTADRDFAFPDEAGTFALTSDIEDHANDLALHTSGIELGYVENSSGTKQSFTTSWNTAITSLVIVVQPSERPVWAEAQIAMDLTASPVAGSSCQFQMIICTDPANPTTTIVGYGSIQFESGGGSANVGPVIMRARGRLGVVAAETTLTCFVARANIASWGGEVLNGNGSSAWKSYMAAFAA